MDVDALCLKSVCALTGTNTSTATTSRMCKFCSALRDRLARGEGGDFLLEDVVDDAAVDDGLCEEGERRWRDRFREENDRNASDGTPTKPTYEAELLRADDGGEKSTMSEGILYPNKRTTEKSALSTGMFSVNASKRKKRALLRKRVACVDRIETWTLEHVRRSFVDAEEAFVRCVEIECGEPGCPPFETIIVLQGLPWCPSRMTIRKRLVTVDVADVKAVVRELWSAWRQFEYKKALHAA